MANKERKINWGVILVVELIICIFIQTCFLNLKVNSIITTQKLHEKISMEALACVEDPHCRIVIDNDVYED